MIDQRWNIGLGKFGTYPTRNHLLGFQLRARFFLRRHLACLQFLENLLPDIHYAWFREIKMQRLQNKVRLGGLRIMTFQTILPQEIHHHGFRNSLAKYNSTQPSDR